MRYETEIAKSAKCETCLYKGRMDGFSTCDYILFTGKRRGCPTGDLCDKCKPIAISRKTAISRHNYAKRHEKIMKGYSKANAEDKTKFCKG